MRFMVYTRNIKDFHLIMIWKLPGPWIQFIIQKLLHTVYKSLQSSGSFQQVFSMSLAKGQSLRIPSVTPGEASELQGAYWHLQWPARHLDKTKSVVRSHKNFLLPGWKSSLWNESALTPTLGFILVLNQLGQFITNTQCCSGTRCTSTTN